MSQLLASCNLNRKPQTWYQQILCGLKPQRRDIGFNMEPPFTIAKLVKITRKKTVNYDIYIYIYQLDM